MAMRQREKILVFVAVGIIGALILFKLYDSVWYGPIRDIDRDIAKFRTSIEKKESKLAKKQELLYDWQSVWEQTVADDTKEAQSVLSKRIKELIKAAGLEEKAALTPGKKKSKKSAAFEQATFTLKAEGELSQIVKFFDLLYQEPYLFKVTSFTLDPPNKPGGLFSLKGCHISALIIKRDLAIRTPEVDRLPFREVALAGSGRYARIAEKNIFSPPIKIETPPGPIKTKEPPDDGPEPPPTGGELVATIMVGQVHEVYVRNSGRSEWYKVGETINDRELVFVHSLGIVLKESDGQHVYVEIGHNINRASPVSAAAKDMSELYDAWRASGIKE